MCASRITEISRNNKVFVIFKTKGHPFGVAFIVDIGIEILKTSQLKAKSGKPINFTAYLYGGTV